jgi:hypothetical protein
MDENELKPPIHLSPAESRVVRALVRERDEAQVALEAYVRSLAPEIAQPQVRQTPAGLVLVDVAVAEEKEEDISG